MRRRGEEHRYSQAPAAHMAPSKGIARRAPRIYRHLLRGEERFAFLDDQIQEVLYAGIPPLRRRRFHLRAGHALEEVYVEQLDTQVDELARHFDEGNDPSKAAEYALQAAEKNARLFNWPRVRRSYERALDSLV